MSIPKLLNRVRKVLVEGTYDATKNAGWGNVSDMVKIKLNGVVQENLYYYVSANLVEDFSSLSKEELENAPVFKVESTTVDLGQNKRMQLRMKLNSNLRMKGKVIF